MKRSRQVKYNFTPFPNCPKVLRCGTAVERVGTDLILFPNERKETDIICILIRQWREEGSGK